ncbi:TauD/TfdA dioxygenase family protein [Reyranella sp.]|uniref:TauD/TfdA dioxygenase family protein n=1 Tax=Reyranella sp. TaxID=1929291 RepID=UPI003D0C952A
MAQSFDVQPVDASFGAVITGVRIPELDQPTWQALHDTWLKYALLIFPGQFLKKDEQVAFAKRFGALEFEMGAVSNVREDGTLRVEAEGDDVVKILKGNEGWHADSTFKPIAAKGAVFSAEVVPTIGGHTGWADMRAAYDALDDATRTRIAPLRAYHSLHYSQSRIGHRPKAGTEDYRRLGFAGDENVLRPLVKTHPDTGRKSLLIGRHAHDIPGLAPEESEALLQELIDFACRPPRVYHHDWRPGDVVIWDNRCLLHQATPFDMTQPRIMWHTRIAGDPVSEAAVG